jgi:hypothetical protein
MINLKQHIKKINSAFAETFFAKYMLGEWGIKVGYTPEPVSVVRMNKQLADWQLSMDCSGALCEQSKGHVSFSCCPPKSQLLQYTIQVDCCPAGYNFDPTDGKCYLPGNTVPIFASPCLYCPTGYSYQIVGSLASCISDADGSYVNLSTAGPHCVNTISGSIAGNPVFKCPTLVPDSVVTKYPVWGDSPFPQIHDKPDCDKPWTAFHPAVLQTVNIVTPPIVTLYYTVDAAHGPISGTNTFTPLDGSGNPLLIGKNMDMLQLTMLQPGVDYSFNAGNGTITLLLGRLFNTNEVYTIITY